MNFVIADIRDGSRALSEGVGLGHEFLRHIERTKVLIHVVDAAEQKDATRSRTSAINAELPIQRGACQKAPGDLPTKPTRLRS